MSSFKTFRTIHRLYKRINRIKTLVQMQSSCLSSSVDIFEVFSSRMKELQCKVESDYANIEFSECEKVRLAAIQTGFTLRSLRSNDTNIIFDQCSFFAHNNHCRGSKSRKLCAVLRFNPFACHDVFNVFQSDTFISKSQLRSIEKFERSKTLAKYSRTNVHGTPIK